jgi:hypothetical protein
MNKEDLEYWTTAEGKRLHVDEMDDKHVRNAFKMLLRRINYHKMKQEAVRKSNRAFEVHGEMAREDHERFLIHEATGIDIENDGLNPFDNEDYIDHLRSKD